MTTTIIRALAITAGACILVTACNRNKSTFDASGSFEAEEVIISAQGTGTIEQFDIEEGQAVKAGQLVGYIDSTQLYLKKAQLVAQVNALLSKKPNVSLQVASLKQQLEAAQKDQKRFTELVKADAATQKQLDDINSQVEVLKKQIAAQQSSLEISTEGISKDAVPLEVQVQQLDDQLQKCRIINPINGTVLTKYSEPHEMATQGKPLYKVADLSSMILRAYISGAQLPNIKLDQKVKVFTDDGKGGYTETEGVVIWISDKAEFTPKTIQTKDERANMVYAVKVRVKNDGMYKIGMYGEIRLM